LLEAGIDRCRPVLAGVDRRRATKVAPRNDKVMAAVKSFIKSML
jgi:hypothetical protein